MSNIKLLECMEALSKRQKEPQQQYDDTVLTADLDQLKSQVQTLQEQQVIVQCVYWNIIGHPKLIVAFLLS